MTRTCNLAVFQLVFVLILALIPSAAAFAAMQQVSQGTYVDSQGGKHLWHIDDSHALVWGGRPYLPAGGLFQSRYLSDGQTDDNWNADTADLQTLKSHGVTDLVLMAHSDAGGITHTPPDALQKMVDYLDANGFTYGLDIDDFPRTPILANVVNPAIYRAPAPQAGTDNSFRNIDGLQSARYFLVSSRDGSVMASGNADIHGGRNADVKLGDGMGGDGTVLILYPERNLTQSSIEGEHLPDIWSNPDNYRDHLLLYFSQIHFGKGLRFFLDPIVDNLGFFGDAGEGMVPDSDSFRLQFQIWLMGHYAHNLEALNTAWALKQDQLPDFETAAKCVPLWYEAKGIGFLLDPSSGTQYGVDPARSKVWDDIQQFREESSRGEMDGIADALKSGVADVPVLYRWTEPSSIFMNPLQSGYDGLLVATDDHGDNIDYNAAGYAFSDAEQAGRTQWLIAQLTPRGLVGGSATQADAGYTSHEVLTEDQSALQDIGVKGYYVNALRRLPQSKYAAINLLDAAPEQLEWLHQASSDMDVASDSLALAEPLVLYYPTNISLPGVGIRELGTGAWWLPTYSPGKAVDLGPGLEGYAMDQPGGGRIFVIWSSDTTVSHAVFDLPKGSKPYVTTAGGTVVTVVQKKDQFTVPVQSEPEQVAGLSDLPLPEGAVDRAFAEAERLISLGTDAHTPMDMFSQRLDYIRNSVLIEKSANSDQLAYQMLHDTLVELSLFLSPYTWIEGEDATSQDFGTIVSSAEASGHAYLWLDTTEPPPAEEATQYHADYAFNVATPGEYTIWASIAPGPPGTTAASPITFSVDEGTAFTVSQPVTDGRPYGSLASAETTTSEGQFTWCQLGTHTLTPGQHTLSLQVTGKAAGTGRYTLGIDCICITRGGFHADGIRKPSLE